VIDTPSRRSDARQKKLYRPLIVSTIRLERLSPAETGVLPLQSSQLSTGGMIANADRPTALLASPAEAAQAAEAMLRDRYRFVPLEDAEQVVALGGDGFLLQTLHDMLRRERLCPVFGMNRGTVGFLMNDWRIDGLRERVNRARAFTVAPLRMDAVTVGGEKLRNPAINEVSLLRETRQTAWIEVSVNGRVVLPELVCDGVLVATPAGSTAYNLSAQGPILPLGTNLVALTPISPFRPRRWRGALIPDDLKILLRVLDPVKRPVSAVADQLEVRDVHTVEVCVDRSLALTLLFDPEHALDERITTEQFAF
jgi:NAD+ kinase